MTIRLLEAQPTIAFRAAGPGTLRLRGGGSVPIRAGQPYRIRVRTAVPARLAYHALLGDAAYADRARLDAVRTRWEERGAVVRERLTGGIYGIAGRVVDNRRWILVAEGDGTERSARRFAEDALARDGARTEIHGELLARPSGRLEVLDARGRVLGTADTLVTLDLRDGAGFTLPSTLSPRRAKGPLTDPTYRGRLHVTVDASGRLAAVLATGLEEVLRGIVPSEIPASAPRAALEAQAVTARSNVLAQIGTRHLNDPYVLCNEVHCQAYRGGGAHAAATDAAVAATHGEALFGRDDHVLVDAVYSAVCGGHGEDNDAVWPTIANPALRGRPDLGPTEAARWEGGLADDGRLREFLAGASTAWCGRAVGIGRGRFRWERRFTARQLDTLLAPLGIGSFRDLEVASRGVSGRARAVVFRGDRGSAVVEGELRIRRLLASLPSAMFLVERDGEGVLLRGGGWGHGVGMCQWGAIARAAAGQDRHEILRAYYQSAEVARIY